MDLGGYDGRIPNFAVINVCCWYWRWFICFAVYYHSCDGTEAENGFSWMIIFSVAGAAALLALFPIVTEISGFRGVTNLLGGSTLATLLLIPLIPVNNEKGNRN